MSGAPLRLDTRERLVFALDVPGHDEALSWIDRLGDEVRFYKIGRELLASGDYFRVLDALAARDKRVFVDLKFFDIPATVAGVIRGLARWPVTWCTVHGWHRGMMEAAAQAHGGQMRLLAVTVLTSMEDQDLREMGISGKTADIVVQRAVAARAAGLDGVIASGQEAQAIRQAVGAGFDIVCPGIRPGPAGDDQRRTLGVAEAFRAGADANVVGRPIRLAADPRAAAAAIQAEIASAISGK